MIAITCDSRAPIAQLFRIKLQDIICDLNSPARTEYPRNRIASDPIIGFISFTSASRTIHDQSGQGGPRSEAGEVTQLKEQNQNK